MLGRVGVAEIHKDGPIGAFAFFHIPAQVIVVVRGPHDGIIDDRAVDGDPADHVVVDGFDLLIGVVHG